MHRNQPKPRRHTRVGEHFQGPTFVVQQPLGNSEQHTHHAVLAADAAHCTVIAVDDNRSTIR